MKKYLQGYPIGSYENLYVNIARMRNGEWAVCWYPKWVAASRLSQAVAQRKEFLNYLRANGGEKIWPLDSVKTIKII